MTLTDRFSLEVCLICYPAFPTNAQGGGVDRYAFELLSYLIGTELNAKSIEFGKIKNPLDLAVKEALFPLKILNIDAKLYHAVSPIGAKTAIICRKFPLITTIHDMLPFFFDYPFITRFHSKFSTLIARKSARIIVPFQTIKRAVVSILKVPPEKVRVINLGVDHNHFRPLPKKTSKIRRILFLSETFLRYRGLDTALKAFSIVAKKMNNVELLIGGEGRDVVSLKMLAYELGIMNKTKFLGFIPEEQLPTYYNAADMLVHPSKLGFGLPMLEAMACGTPVISSDAFDAPEFMNGVGLTVGVNDVNGLTAAILAILENEDLKEELSEKGLEKAKSFSWEKTAQETLNLYKEVFG